MGLSFTVSSTPSSLWQWLPQFEYADKLEHGVLYAGLALAFVFALTRTTRLSVPASSAPPAWLLTAAYGIVEEAHQLFVAGRTTEVYDWGAGVAGAALALAAALAWARRRGDTSPVFSRSSVVPLSVCAVVLLAALSIAGACFRLAVTDVVWNGDFERCAMLKPTQPAWWEPWSNSPTARCLYLAADDEGSRRVRCENLLAGDKCCWVSRPLALRAGAQYVLVVRYRCSPGSKGRPEVGIAGHDFYLAPTATWKTFSTRFVPKRVEDRRIRLWLYRRPKQWVEWDDVRLTRVR